MPLPETIAVKYTEEEAEYLSMRPVVRQMFRLAELVDMVLSVTGKDVARIQQILRSGSVVYHYYRYWWPGFEADAGDLGAFLATYPDADPARPFRAEECLAVLLETSGTPPRRSVELRKDTAASKRLFRTRSLWNCLMGLARTNAPTYREYSYSHRADLYSRALSAEETEALVRDAPRLASRGLRMHLHALPETSRVMYVCPRNSKGFS